MTNIQQFAQYGGSEKKRKKRPNISLPLSPVRPDKKRTERSEKERERADASMRTPRRIGKLVKELLGTKWIIIKKESKKAIKK
jgi:hypothetical protein